MKKLIFLLAISAAFGLLAGCETGGGGGSSLVLLGARHYSGNGGTTSILYTVDTSNGTAAEIGDISYAVNGLAFDFDNGILYGTTSTNDGIFPDGLIEINIQTGAGTPIGAGAGRRVNNPTIDSSGTMYAWTEDFDDLVTIDTVTGVATVVGDSGLHTKEHTLAFDAADNLYFVNTGGIVYSINTATGAAGASVGTIDWTPHPDYEIAHHGDFHPDSGMLWALDITDSLTTTRNILVIDIGTLTIDRVIPTMDSLHVLVFAER